MKPLGKLLYFVNLLALLALSLSFLSFFLMKYDGMRQNLKLDQIVPYTTKYVPILLWPISLAMVAVLIMRYMTKGRNEGVGFDDFLAGVVAVGLQLATVIVWRAQGHEVSGPFLANIPDVKLLVENASKFGLLGVAGLQFAAFVFYWIANPDPKGK